MPGGPRFSGPLEAPFCLSAPDRPSLGGLPRAGTAAGCQFGSFLQAPGPFVQLRRAAAYPIPEAAGLLACWLNWPACWCSGGGGGGGPWLPPFFALLPLRPSAAACRRILPLLSSLLHSHSSLESRTRSRSRTTVSTYSIPHLLLHPGATQ
jgi:hypothetical protein